MTTAVRPAAALAAGALVLVASLSIQTATLLGRDVVAAVGAPGTTGLRLAVGAAVLLLVTRPWRRGSRPDRRELVAAAGLGVAIAVMNLALYVAVQRLGLGLAVAVDFLGPAAVAALALRGRRLAVPALSLLGVVLVAGPRLTSDPLGLVVALVGAAAFAGYTVLTGHLGESGTRGLAVATTVAAVLLSPFSLVVAPRLEPAAVAPLVASAVLGVVVAFALDLAAVRRVGAGLVAVLFAGDPVLAALLGHVALDEPLGARVLAGAVLVTAAGGAAIALAGRPAAGAEPAAAPAEPLRVDYLHLLAEPAPRSAHALAA